MLRVVLVDDERCVLEELEYLLQGRAKVVGKFNNPVKALESIVDLAPDAVFLDVEMPGISGLETASEILNILPEAIILFVTAYDQYAVDAFELNAVDYLVKPVQPDRLDKALERIVKRLAKGRQEEFGEKIHQWLHNSLSTKQRVTVNLWNGRHLEIVSAEKVTCCFLPKGMRKVLVVTDEGKVYQASDGLTNFVAKAGLAQLIRCHRSYYINPSMITRVEPGEGEQYQAYVQGFTEQIPISRNYRQKILNVLHLFDK